MIEKINYICDDYIIVNDGMKFDINPQTKEFDYENGVRYICYNLNINLRTHNTICDYFDETFKIPAVIEHTKAVDLIKKLINISAHNLSISSIPCEKTMDEAYDEIKNSLKNMISSSNHNIQDSKILNELDKLMKIFISCCDSIQSEDIEKGILASYPTCFELKLDINTTPLGKLLEYLLEYIVAYNSFHPYTLPYHSLNNNIGHIYTIIYILTVDSSILDGTLFTKPEDIILHSLFSKFVDVITDKCGKILFINEENIQASTILRQYHTKYPILSKITSRETAKLYSHQLGPIIEQLQKECINLMPFLISYTMPDDERILYIYEHISKNRQILEKDKIQTKWFSSEEYLNILKKVTGSVKKSMYHMKILQDIIPYFITMFPNLTTEK